MPESTAETPLMAWNQMGKKYTVAKSQRDAINSVLVDVPLTDHNHMAPDTGSSPVAG